MDGEGRTLISPQSGTGKILLDKLQEQYALNLKRLLAGEDPDARGAAKMCVKLAKDLLDTEL